MYKIILVLKILILSESYGKLIPISVYDETMRLSLARCISTASEENFNRFEVITVSLASSINLTRYSQSTAFDTLLLPELFDKNKWTLLVKQPSGGRPAVYQPLSYLSRTKSDGYVVQLQSSIEINTQLSYLKRHPSWNPHAKFIVVSSLFYRKEENRLGSIIRKLWACDILNGVVLTPDKHKPSTFNIYSWFPYDHGSCGNKFNKLIHIDSCTDGLMANRTEWFPNKFPTTMNNCSVRVRTLDYPPYVVKPVRVGNSSFYRVTKGLEVQLLNMLAGSCNLFMQYEILQNDSVGDIYWPSIQSTGLVGALVRGEADIAVASLSATWQRHMNLDSSSAYFQDSIGFCVPHAGETSQWQKLSGIMTLDIWIGVTVTMIVISVITKFLSHKEINTKEIKIYSDQGSVMQKVLAISIGHAINIQPRSNQVRFFLMLWIIFSLHLDTIYQTYLMSALTNVEYEYQIKTVDDILKSDLELLFRPQDMKYFESLGSASTKQSVEIVSRWKECYDLDECLRRTAFKKDSVIAASRLYIQYAKSSYISKTGLPLLYCIQEQIVSFPVVAYMRHGFPLQHKFDDIISRINSGGYIQRFEQDIFQGKNFTGGFKNASFEEEEDFLNFDVTNKLLTFEHIKPIFMMLFAGYCTSGVVFFLEWLIFKRGKGFRKCFGRNICKIR